MNVCQNHHYECLSSPLTLDDFYPIVDDEKIFSKKLQLVFKPNVLAQIGNDVGSNKLANVIFNQRKTIVFSFGEIFAN